MSINKPIRLVVSPELRSAIDAQCAAAGLELSDYVRRLIVADLRRPELLETLRREGRPKLQPDKQPPARKKAAAQKRR